MNDQRKPVQPTDIVVRLRLAASQRARGGPAWADYSDAADEIEHLRALNIRLLEEKTRIEQYAPGETWNADRTICTIREGGK